MCQLNDDGTWNPDGECDGCGYCDSFEDDEYCDELKNLSFEWDYGCQS